MSDGTSKFSTGNTGQLFPTVPGPLREAILHAEAIRTRGGQGLKALQRAFSTRAAELHANLDNIQQQAGRVFGSAALQLNEIQRRAVDAQSLHTGRASYFAAASLSALHSPRQPPQPVAEVAMHPGEVAARLRGVIVYTVVNSKNEFVLVSGEGTERPKQLGLFFFSQADADSLIDKIKQQDPRLGRQARVLPVGMDQVYKFTVAPRQKGLDTATFRFMPEMSQIASAVELYREAGLEVDSFMGVPVFQVEGLSVKTEKAQYTPLFLSKADLDSAIGNAAFEQEDKATRSATLKYEKAKELEAKAQEELEAAEDDRARRRAEARCSKAEARAQRALSKLEEVKSKNKPKIEVGSLEEVIVNMEYDTKGEWGDVMFIPPGALNDDK